LDEKTERVRNSEEREERIQGIGQREEDVLKKTANRDSILQIFLYVHLWV